MGQSGMSMGRLHGRVSICSAALQGRSGGLIHTKTHGFRPCHARSKSGLTLRPSCMVWSDLATVVHGLV